MWRKSGILLIALAAGLAWCMAAQASEEPRYLMDALHVQPPVVAGTKAELMSAGTVRASGHETVRFSSAALPGKIMGTTWYDWQHNGSTGRQVDEANGLIQVEWMRSSLPNTDDRTIYWNKVSVTNSPAPYTLDNGTTIGLIPLGNPGSTDGGPALATGVRPGYVNFRDLPTGRGVGFMHDAPDPGPGDANLVCLDASAGLGVFIANAAQQPAGQKYIDDGVIWPKGTVSVCGPDTMVHVVGTWSGADQALNNFESWYWRGMVSGTGVTWSPPILIDTASFITSVIEAHGDSVVVAYTKPNSSDEGDDIRYRVSEDCGVTWGPKVNVSNYADNSTEYAYIDLDLLIDPGGVIHIVWNTLFHDTTDGSLLVVPTNLNHWNSQRGTIRRVTSGSWENNTVGGGCSEIEQNGLGPNAAMFAKMNLSVKPAGAGPGAGIADELLYCIWVQGGPVDSGSAGDCSTQDSLGTPGGVVNSEIYWSVSSDDGFTWDRPQNVTGTKTPNCLPGDCHSENWVTAARSADSGVYISYTDDAHAGGAVNATPLGEWALGTYNVQALEAREPVIAPVISVGPRLNYLELNTATTGSNTMEVTIDNFGNADLNFDVVVTGDGGGNSHVTVNGGGTYHGSVEAGGSPSVLTIEYDGLGLPDRSVWNWRLEVTSNDKTNDPSEGGTPISINLNVWVADVWFACENDTISSGTHRLAVTSCLKLGEQAKSKGGMYRYSDSSQWLYSASPIIVKRDLSGHHRHVFRDLFWNSIEERSRDSNRAFRAQSEITVVPDTTYSFKGLPIQGSRAYGLASSTDSTLLIDWEVRMFKSLGAPQELTSGALALYTVRPGPVADGLFGFLDLGAGFDPDIDSSYEANAGMAEEETQFVCGQGGYFEVTGGDSVFCPQTRYAALFYVALDSTCSGAAQGGQLLDNEVYVKYQLRGAFHDDSMYNWMTSNLVGWGSGVYPDDSLTDGASDVCGLLKDRTVAWTGSETYRFAFGVAVSDVSEADLKDQVRMLRHAANAACAPLCGVTMTGDVNASQTVTSADIITLVNYVFKGGAVPLPCESAGDVNCTGTVNSSDIITTINYVLKGGAPPCNACSTTQGWGC